MGKSIVFCALLGTIFALTSVEGVSEDALKKIKEGWYQELVYEQDLLVPTTMCYDSRGTLYVYDPGRHVLLKMTPDGKISAVTEPDDLQLRAIAWQPKRERLIGFDINAMYVLRGNRFKKLREFDGSFLVSTVTVNPTDDSFFVGHEGRGMPIVHLDPRGKPIQILKERAHGCFQLVYHDEKRLLFFTETYTGSVSVMDLASRSEEVLIRNIGVPDTSEPIAIFLDDAGTLWFYTANEGLHRWINNRFELVGGPMMGAGPIIWSPELDNWIGIEYAGSNLVTYDYDLYEAIEITPYLNALDIVENSAGKIFYPKYDFIYTITEGGPVPFSEPLRPICWNVALDSRDTLYAAMEEDLICRISSTGEVQRWCSGLNAVSSMCYDRSSDSLIVVTHRDERATVHQIPIDAPQKIRALARIDRVFGNNVLPRVTTDGDGNIYVLEWGRNEILKVNRELKGAETLFRDVLASRDITVPGFDYSRHENAFVIGTLEYYHLISLENGEREILAMNKNGADNFAIYERSDGTLVLIHSGQVFRLHRQ
jgi:hypothetical protein